MILDTSREDISKMGQKRVNLISEAELKNTTVKGTTVRYASPRHHRYSLEVFEKLLPGLGYLSRKDFLGPLTAGPQEGSQ